MPEFWENTYNSNDKMWGEKPADNALAVLELFQRNNLNNVLIPGFGYGRNARVFYEKGFKVSGIEISATAIERARRYFREDVIIHHGSVTDMPYDDQLHESIYCYSLIHLLNQPQRAKLIDDCYAQLTPGGLMIFVALTVKDRRYGQGEEVAKNTFYSPNGLNLFFYDEAAVKEEFGAYNIIEAKEIDEPLKNPTEKHWMIVCKKKQTESI